MTTLTITFRDTDGQAVFDDPKDFYTDGHFFHVRDSEGGLTFFPADRIYSVTDVAGAEAEARATPKADVVGVDYFHVHTTDGDHRAIEVPLDASLDVTQSEDLFLRILDGQGEILAMLNKREIMLITRGDSEDA